MSHRFAAALGTLFLTGLVLAPTGSRAQVPADVLPLPGAAAPSQLVTPATPAEVPQLPEAAGPPEPTAPVIVPPGREQVSVTAPRSTGVVAIVNDFVISDYDLDQRIALFVATSGVRLTRENQPQIRAQVLRSLEDEVLELQEAQKHKITISKADVDKALQSIASDNKLSVDQIFETIKEGGVARDTFQKQVSAQLTWQRLVAARYGTDIFISDQQVDDAMNRLKQGSDKPQFLLSEIFVAVDRPEDEMTTRTSAEQIVQQLKQGAPFGTVAGQFSQSPSAAEGGDIGWVIQGQLSEEIDQELLKLRPGEIAGPVRAEGGYYVLLLRDRREPVGTEVPEAPAPGATDPSVALPLDRLLIPVPPNADDMYRQRAMVVANSVSTQAHECSDLPIVAKQVPGTVYTHLGSMKPDDLAKDLRDALLKTEPGQVVPPFFSPAGVEVIMRCDPARQKVVVFQMPTREELQQQIFLQQMAILAKSYLRDLRRDAVVETR